MKASFYVLANKKGRFFKEIRNGKVLTTWSAAYARGYPYSRDAIYASNGLSQLFGKGFYPVEFSRAL